MIRGMCRDCNGCLLCQEQNEYDYDARDDYEADRGEEEREERLLYGKGYLYCRRDWKR